MAASDSTTDDSLYPIAVLIDELKNEDVQVNDKFTDASSWIIETTSFGGMNERTRCLAGSL